MRNLLILLASIITTVSSDAMGNEMLDDPQMVHIEKGRHRDDTIMHHMNNMAFKKAVQLQNQANSPVKKRMQMAKPYLPSLKRRTKRQSNRSSVCTAKDDIFRNITGFCNNKEHEEWGSFFSATIRFFEPAYDDEETGDLIDCHCEDVRRWTRRCSRESQPDPTRRSRRCADLNCDPIAIPLGDPTYCPHATSRSCRKCMEFTRSLAAQLDGPREQLNELTVYIDASNVYGSDPDTASTLRMKQGGQMRVTKMGRPGNWQAFLPQLRDNVGCESKRNKKCFMAGDSRNSIQVGLTTMHTMWLREHNRIAKELSKLNTRWSDERLYQEARKIVGALMQQITYEEYLPKILGPDIMKEFNLLSGRNGGLGYTKDKFYDGYNPTCDATTTNVFSTAAFRFGHSLLDGLLSFNNETQTQDVGDNWFNPDVMYARKGNIDRIFKGMAKQPCQGMDRFYHESIRDKLFGDLDLAATNIQRGRDHGLHPYLKYRELFVEDKSQMPKSWLDLVKVVGMDPHTAVSLYSAYQQTDSKGTKESVTARGNNSLGDIDAYTGFLSEPPVPGGIIGITSAKIVADQFIRLKDCDRFFYENGGQPASFTKAQLAEIRKVRLSHLVCAHFNTNIIQNLQEDIFALPNSKNREQPCSRYKAKRMDLRKWK